MLVPMLMPASRATSRTATVGARRRPRSSATRGQPVGAEVRGQSLRDPNRPVGRLIVLEEGDDRAWKRQARCVERVDELRLGARLAPEADSGAARLKIGEGARARDLEPRGDPRRPDLEVVGARGAEAGIARGELDHAVGKLEPLEHRLGVTRQALVLRGGILGPRQPDKLNLVELVHADEAARVLAVRARLAPEARG